jgi:hypothetical protein
MSTTSRRIHFKYRIEIDGAPFEEHKLQGNFSLDAVDILSDATIPLTSKYRLVGNLGDDKRFVVKDSFRDDKSWIATIPGEFQVVTELIDEAFGVSTFIKRPYSLHAKSMTPF